MKTKTKIDHVIEKNLRKGQNKLNKVVIYQLQALKAYGLIILKS